jgi:hypothetical protein
MAAITLKKNPNHGKPKHAYAFYDSWKANAKF